MLKIIIISVILISCSTTKTIEEIKTVKNDPKQEPVKEENNELQVYINPIFEKENLRVINAKDSKIYQLSKAYYQLGTLYMNQNFMRKNLNKAIYYLNKVIDNYPKSKEYELAVAIINRL